MEVILKPTARRDLRSILAYTEGTWGVEQRDRYRATIDQAFGTLRDNPLYGRPLDRVSPGLRAYQVERHVLYYRVRGDVVTIVRILHEKMDVARHISG